MWIGNLHQLLLLFFMVLGFELRVLSLLAGTLPLEPCSQTFFALVIFQVVSHIFSQGWPQTKFLLPIPSS
jgi:hypothetical protein